MTMPTTGSGVTCGRICAIRRQHCSASGICLTLMLLLAMWMRLRLVEIACRIWIAATLSMTFACWGDAGLGQLMSGRRRSTLVAELDGQLKRPLSSRANLLARRDIRARGRRDGPRPTTSRRAAIS